MNCKFFLCVTGISEKVFCEWQKVKLFRCAAFSNNGQHSKLTTCATYSVGVNKWRSSALFTCLLMEISKQLNYPNLMYHYSWLCFTEHFNHYYMQSFCGRISSLNFKIIVIVKKISKLDGIIYIRIQTPLIPPAPRNITC